MQSHRRERAIELCNIALAVVKAHGEWEPVRGGPHLLVSRVGALVIAYRTPFQKLPDAPADAKYLAALRGRGSTGNLPYGLDVNAPAKVLNVEWSDDGHVDVISYRTGDWEQRLLGLGSP